jgi:hypothetical protein
LKGSTKEVQRETSLNQRTSSRFGELTEDPKGIPKGVQGFSQRSENPLTGYKVNPEEIERKPSNFGGISENKRDLKGIHGFRPNLDKPPKKYKGNPKVIQ